MKKSETKKKKSANPMHKILVALIILVLAWFVIKALTKKPAVTIDQAPGEEQVLSESETAELLKQVGQIMILPDEEPAIFDISDPAALVDQQPFFAGSQVGDKVLVFPQAAKALIYSPTRNVIVNVGPVSYEGDPTQQGQPAPVVTPEPVTPPAAEAPVTTPAQEVPAQ